MKGRDRNRTRSGSKEHQQRTVAQAYVYRYVALVSERPHPLKRVPGIKHCRWNGDIGRWVKVEW